MKRGNDFESRKVFLDIDDISDWGQDGALSQNFPRAEKVRITGLEPGPAGSWDTRVANYGCVLHDEGKFRMWYCCQPDALSYDENADVWLSCYAESDDGIVWRKPDLGITGQKRYPGNNLLTLPGSCQGVVRALPGSDYKYLAVCIQTLPLKPGITDVPGNSNDDRGTFIFGSDDGLHWKKITKVCQHGDCANLFADTSEGRYLLFQKAGVMHGFFNRRSMIGLQSKDGIHWEGYDGPGRWNECFVADDYDDLIAKQRGFLLADYYHVTVHRVGNLYISIEDLFYMGLPLRTIAGQNPSGHCYLRLGFSHNGINWRHPMGRPSWLELGQPGDFDAGFIVPGTNTLEHNGEVLNYYSGTPYRHGWCIDINFSINPSIPLAEQNDTYRIVLARIKRDRYASIAATYRGRFEMDPSATGKTPLAIDNRRPQLYINARCPDGSIRVGLKRYGTNEFLPGYSYDDCIPFSGDEIKAPVKFRKKAIADIPSTERFYLCFEVAKGEIFAYEWDR
jgi:hypothetical protein